MARRSRHREEESNGNADEWLVTYSDMVTLLLCFFVLLFSMATIDVQKFREIMEGIQIALNQGVMERGETIDENNMLQQDALNHEEIQNYLDSMKQLSNAFSDIQQHVQEAGLSEVVIVTFEEQGILIRFTDNILFQSARAKLNTEAEGILSKIAEVLKTIPNEITVEGHTDNLPLVTNNLYKDNWDLSTARATSVARFLMEDEEVNPSRVVISGYGQWKPIADNEQQEGRKENRRVDVIIKRIESTTIEGDNAPGKN